MPAPVTAPVNKMASLLEYLLEQGGFRNNWKLSKMLRCGVKKSSQLIEMYHSAPVNLLEQAKSLKTLNAPVKSPYREICLLEQTRYHARSSKCRSRFTGFRAESLPRKTPVRGKIEKRENS
jgi:hypothetical protein